VQGRYELKHGQRAIAATPKYTFAPLD